MTERAGGVGQGVGSEFKPQYCKNKKINNQSKMDSGCGSSGRAPAYQPKGIQFKPPYCQKKSRRGSWEC
jgi:hypothetical protein